MDIVDSRPVAGQFVRVTCPNCRLTHGFLTGDYAFHVHCANAGCGFPMTVGRLSPIFGAVNVQDGKCMACGEPADSGHKWSGDRIIACPPERNGTDG